MTESGQALLTMDAQREDLPRISVGTLHLWRLVKAQYTSASIALLDARLPPKDRDLYISHIHEVHSILVFI